jgi:TATA-box binding protein (TBP) (component of TFIID and TFIIIB)
MNDNDKEMFDMIARTHVETQAMVLNAWETGRMIHTHSKSFEEIAKATGETVEYLQSLTELARFTKVEVLRQAPDVLMRRMSDPMAMRDLVQDVISQEPID